MLITTNEKNELIVENAVKTKLVVSSGVVKSTSFDIVVSAKLDGSGFHIGIPGEYEVGQMSLIAQASSLSDKIDIVEVIVDDISMVVLFEGFEYSQRVHDNLGGIDILVSMESNQEKLSEIINKFDPEVVIGMDGCGEEILRHAGINQIEPLKKEKFSSDRFGADEFTIHGYILSKK
jgi:hypothetical protein